MEILEKLGHIYSGALTEVIATVTGIHLQVESMDSENELGDIIGAMCLVGKKNGILFVSAKKDDIRILCSRFIGIPVEEVLEKDIDDTICELVNMTAGSAKLRLGDTDYMFSLTQPFSIKGNDISIVTKAITHVIAGTLTDGKISVKFKAVYS